jgi:hypothetical protein
MIVINDVFKWLAADDCDLENEQKLASLIKKNQLE